MNLSAIVLHNINRANLFMPYDPLVSELYHAHEFQIVADNIQTGANLIWDLTNVDDANHLTTMRPDLSLYGPQVTEYRQRRNRSLSVGDVIVFFEINGTDQRYAGSLAVAPAGFTDLEVRPIYNSGSNLTAHSLSYDAFQNRLSRDQ